MLKAFALKEGVERHQPTTQTQKPKMKKDTQPQTLCPAQAKEDAMNDALMHLLNFADKSNPDLEKMICYGSIFDSPQSTPKASEALEKLRDAIYSCELAIEEAIENAKQENEIEKAAQAIADSILSPCATDAETHGEVYHLAAKKIREACKDIQDEDFSILIGGTVCDFGKTLQGKKPNRPWDA